MTVDPEEDGLETDTDEEEDDQGGHWSPCYQLPAEAEVSAPQGQARLRVNSVPSCLRPGVTEGDPAGPQ